MAITVTQCIAVGERIIVVYSAPDQANKSELEKLANFYVEHPPGSPEGPFPHQTKFEYVVGIPGTIITPQPRFLKAGEPFKVRVSTKDVAGSAIGGLQEPIATLKNDFDERADAATGAVRGVTGAIGDATSYPFLTREVGFGGGLAATSPGSGGGSSLAQTVGVAMQQVLGWKVRNDDPKGFIGALTQSFSCKVVEGHTECTWTPRSYAVQTDLSGGITGAQASIYARTKEAVDQSLPLLDGLYPLRRDADKEFIDAARAVVRSRAAALVTELGIPGGPRVSRVDQIFLLLLGVTPQQTDPDLIAGELGKLREQLGLSLSGSPGNQANSVEDEQDQTNFRIIVDYLTSLRQSWENNKKFFNRSASSTTPGFFGTQLVLVSRQLSVVAETVDEVRFALESVFIGPSERQTLLLENVPDTGDPSGSTAILLEEFLTWVYTFASEEGPGLIREGGIFAVNDAFLSIAIKLQAMAASLPGTAQLPGEAGFHTQRVQRTLQELASQLAALVADARKIPRSAF